MVRCYILGGFSPPPPVLTSQSFATRCVQLTAAGRFEPSVITRARRSLAAAPSCMRRLVIPATTPSRHGAVAPPPLRPHVGRRRARHLPRRVRKPAAPSAPRKPSDTRRFCEGCRGHSNPQRRNNGHQRRTGGAAQGLQKACRLWLWCMEGMTHSGQR